MSSIHRRSRRWVYYADGARNGKVLYRILGPGNSVNVHSGTTADEDKYSEEATVDLLPLASDGS